MAKYTVRECKRMLDNLGNQASQLMVRYAVRECLASPWWPGQPAHGQVRLRECLPHLGGQTSQLIARYAVRECLASP